MLGINSEEIIQVLSMVSLAIIAVFMGLKKLLKDWRSNDAETSIITLMHSELERVSEQNTALSTELGRLHHEVINLTQELQKLTVENQRLQLEVCALTEEISIFKRMSTGKGTNDATS